MKKSRFTETQIGTVRQEAELGISEATFYSWRFVGMHVTEIKRIKKLEEENARLKRMYIDLSLVNDALKQVLEKKLGGLNYLVQQVR
jgi:putative transposase